MRVALCFYGLLGGIQGKAGDRTGNSKDVLNIAHPLFKKHILDINNVDVFIHSWDTDLQEEIVKLYKPVGTKFEEQKIFSIPFPLEDTKRVQNHFSRWYSCKEVIKLKKQYEQDNNFTYDFVALSRQDIAWQVDVDFSQFDNEYFYVPNWRQQFTGERMGYPHGGYKKSLQDIWCFSNSEYMDEFINIYDNIARYSIENPDLMGNKGISNHRLMYYQLVKMDALPFRLQFAFNHDKIERSDMPLVRYKFYNDKS